MTALGFKPILLIHWFSALYEHFTISGEKMVKHPRLSPIDTNCVILKTKISAINEIFILLYKRKRCHFHFFSILKGFLPTHEVFCICMGFWMDTTTRLVFIYWRYFRRRDDWSQMNPSLSAQSVILKMQIIDLQLFASLSTFSPHIYLFERFGQ